MIVIALSVGVPASSASPAREAPIAAAAPAKSHSKAAKLVAIRASLKQGIVDRRQATWRHQDWLEISRSQTNYPERWVKGTGYLRWIKHLWSQRADHYWRLREVTLRDFAVVDGNHAWQKAVREVQRVFPGTESWLLSCSDAEGGWGRWVTYGGGSDYMSAYRNYVVGGWMQFKYPTFSGMFSHAMQYLRGKGYRVPASIEAGGIAGWRSALAQALAAGWARYTGNDDSHWSASWNTGCS